MTRSPTRTCSMGMSISLSFRTTRAVLACKPIKALIAALVRPLAIVSISPPSVTSVMIEADVSKYTCPPTNPSVTATL